MNTNFKLYILPIVVAMSLLLSGCCKNCRNETSNPLSNVSNCEGSQIKSADLMIDQIIVKESQSELDITVNVKLGRDDTAYDVRLFVLLPIETDVISFTANDPSTKISQCGGYVLFKWESIDPCNINNPSDKNCMKSVNIKTGRFESCNNNRHNQSDGVCHENISAFVLSNTPDANTHNNFKAWSKANCETGQSNSVQCPYGSGLQCIDPVFEPGRIKLPICPEYSPKCGFPVPVDTLCKQVHNCPGCDFAQLCVGDTFEFLDVKDYDITVYIEGPDLSVRPIKELKADNGKVSLTGTEDFQNLKEGEHLVLLFTPLENLQKEVVIPFKFIPSK